jgi:hypothetical protein
LFFALAFEQLHASIGRVTTVMDMHVYIPAANAWMLLIRQLSKPPTAMNISTHQKTYVKPTNTPFYNLCILLLT